jgi:hypothetical protein
MAITTNLNKMTSRLPTLLILLTLWTSPVVFSQENIPNDPYYKDQISFHNPGGRITLDTRSYKPSYEEFDAEKGIDLNIEKAWGNYHGKQERGRRDPRRRILLQPSRYQGQYLA